MDPRTFIDDQAKDVEDDEYEDEDETTGSGSGSGSASASGSSSDDAGNVHLHRQVDNSRVAPVARPNRTPVEGVILSDTEEDPRTDESDTSLEGFVVSDDAHDTTSDEDAAGQKRKGAVFSDSDDSDSGDEAAAARKPPRKKLVRKRIETDSEDDTDA